jgi:glutathione S-transferase
MNEPSALPILYTFRRCPYAMRARMALAYAGVAVEIREVVLRDKPPELIAASPKATVPVLQKSDGTVIDESLEIMRWALNQSDPQDWQNTGRTLTAELILANDTSFKKNLDRYKYHNEKSEHPRGHYQELAAEFLTHLERCLVRHGGKGLVRDWASLADIAIFPFVRQFAEADQKWFDAAPYPLLHDWLDRHIQSDVFARTMKKYPQWKAGSPALDEHWPATKVDQGFRWVPSKAP